MKPNNLDQQFSITTDSQFLHPKQKILFYKPQKASGYSHLLHKRIALIKNQSHPSQTPRSKRRESQQSIPLKKGMGTKQEEQMNEGGSSEADLEIYDKQLSHESDIKIQSEGEMKFLGVAEYIGSIEGFETLEEVDEEYSKIIYKLNQYQSLIQNIEEVSLNPIRQSIRVKMEALELLRSDPLDLEQVIRIEQELINDSNILKDTQNTNNSEHASMMAPLEQQLRHLQQIYQQMSQKVIGEQSDEPFYSSRQGEYQQQEQQQESLLSQLSIQKQKQQDLMLQLSQLKAQTVPSLEVHTKHISKLYNAYIITQVQQLNIYLAQSQAKSALYNQRYQSVQNELMQAKQLLVERNASLSSLSAQMKHQSELLLELSLEALQQKESNEGIRHRK